MDSRKVKNLSLAIFVILLHHTYNVEVLRHVSLDIQQIDFAMVCPQC